MGIMLMNIITLAVITAEQAEQFSQRIWDVQCSLPKQQMQARVITYALSYVLNNMGII